MSNPSPVGKETKTVSSTAVGLAAITDGANSALVSVETAAIRYWADGSTPTSSQGLAAESGDQVVLNMKLASFLAIRRDSADATLQVQYFDGTLNPGKSAAGSEVTLGGDIEIGAVELKDATTDTRAVVGAVSGLTGASNGIGVAAFITPSAAVAGLSTYSNINLVATGVSIKGTAGKVHGWYIANNASSVRYVRLYDSASAPTVGTTAALIVIGLPANSAANVFSPSGITFAAGIGIGATTLVAANDATAPSANDVVANVFYV